ncbi:MAG: hypothetical protein N2204_05015 [Anaerolineae bacterium]|nr:hypothetical protein [Anaerolineae bacterium]
MRVVAGILLLVIGIIFPMGMLAWLSSRFNRRPRPPAAQVGLLLALNGLLPLALVLAGLGLMTPQLWEAAWLRAAVSAAGLGALGALVALAFIGRGSSTGGGHGG